MHLVTTVSNLTRTQTQKILKFFLRNKKIHTWPYILRLNGLQRGKSVIPKMGWPEMEGGRIDKAVQMA